MIVNLSAAAEPSEILGLPSVTSLYIVTSPATIFVTAPADPIVVSPVIVVIEFCVVVAMVPAKFVAVIVPLVVKAPVTSTKVAVISTSPLETILRLVPSPEIYSPASPKASL